MPHRLQDDQIDSPFSDAPAGDHASFEQLRSRLRWQLLTAYAAPLLLLAFAFHYLYSDNLKTGIDTHLRSVAENKRNTVSLFLQERVANTRGALTQLTLPVTSGHMQLLLAELRRESPTFVDVGLFDPRGKLVAYAGPFPQLEGRNYGAQAWYRRLMTGARGYWISDVFLGFRDRPHFVVAVRRTIDGKDWVLRASVDPEKFAELVSRSLLMEEVEALIVNRKGQLQTVTDGGGVVRELSGIPRRGLETRVLELPVQGRTYLTALAWIQEVDWALVVRIPTSIAYAPLTRARLVLCGILGAALLGIVGLVVTRTRRIVEQLEAAVRAKEDMRHQLFSAAKLASVGEMAAGVAHEINNPLAIIYEEAGMMRDTLDPQFGLELDKDELSERLDAVMEAALRGRTITRKLLAFAREHDSELSLHDINALVERVIGMKHNELNLANVKVEPDLQEGLPQVQVNANQMDQVLLNLVNNARDAMGGAPGTLGVSTRFEEGQVCLEVSDTGCGMSPRQMEKIFFPFFTTKAVGKGTGLGLSISYGIVKSFGGRIEVQSEEGRGTTFTVMLPARGSAARKRAPLGDADSDGGPAAAQGRA